MKFGTYYMDIKRKHLNFASKNVNLSFLENNIKRWYFTERYIHSKFLNNENVKIKKLYLFNTYMNLKELKISEIDENKFHYLHRKPDYTIDNYSKVDELNKRKKLKEKKSNLFNNQTANPNSLAHIENLNNIINIKINNIFYKTKIYKNFYTMNNQKHIQCKTGNIKEKENIENIQNISNQIKEEKNIKDTNIDNNTNSILNNEEKKIIKTHMQIKDVNDVIIDIKNEKNVVIEKKKYSFYISKIALLLNNLFEKHLLLMNCLIAGTLYMIADIACQIMEVHNKNKDYDFLRTLRMSFIGLSLEGPIMTWWYGKILSNFIKSKPNTFIYKSLFPTLFDNFIFGPIHLAVFFFYNGILKNQKKSEIVDKIVNTGIKVFLVSLMTWTPLTLVNFIFVPRIYQATVVFFADFFWVIFLSWCANKK
ncbi:conserved Plasmodium membrane protein, unknown function [Plasmodium gallinaceum]|uniref:Protein Mpv17 n=1 Tax=Plasmodium gallinaceum TaxID=5849 RepID=A0A1J1GZT7_PLAGA|nr:conserved Plasmodium membrane protein, unknown function [Plasmodium gallinaceum]CRG97799.1 conserved Plasmodium membrane protein, unknown function [Plasmodium gallinaceum]